MDEEKNLLKSCPVVWNSVYTRKSGHTICVFVIFIDHTVHKQGDSLTDKLQRQYLIG